MTILDEEPLNLGDLSWSNLELLGELTVYPRSKPNEVVFRAQDADAVFTNKVILNKEILSQLPKCFCLVIMLEILLRFTKKKSKKGKQLNSVFGVSSCIDIEKLTANRIIVAIKIMTNENVHTILLYSSHLHHSVLVF
jgi:hypothetical protein